MKDLPPFLITMFIKIVEQLCPQNKSKVGHPIKYETEVYLNLIFRRMRTGIQWNEFQKLNIIRPEYSGICKKQRQWVKCGVFKEFWKRCIIFYSKRKGIQWNSLLVDASYVKNIRGRNLLGRNPTDRGRNSSKISALTDKRGVPLSIIIEKGNVHDSKLLATTLDNLITRKRCDKRRKKNLHADLGYYGAKCSETIKNFGYKPVIPIKKHKGKSKPLVTTDSKLNNAIRSRVEAYFGWIDQYRLLHLRHELYSDTYLALTQFASGCIAIQKCL
jgi:transposase